LILAGGAGTRLDPLTRVMSKQLLPVYDKPMVFYPLSTLMAAGLREILVITTPQDAARFQALLGDGSAWGLSLSYAEQQEPGGLAQAYLLGRAFLAGAPSCLILGDNLFHGAGFAERMVAAARQDQGATVFGARVERPERYGVAELDGEGRLLRIVEKPARAPSPWAVTGLYLYDGEACEIAASLRPSARGQLEITDLNNRYLERGRLSFERLAADVTWLDMGTPDSLLDAAVLLRELARGTGATVGSPEAAAYAQGWIDAGQLERLAAGYGDVAYGRSLRGLLRAERRR
jgi:glucose-1-phosphate thymidylyltransferase